MALAAAHHRVAAQAADGKGPKTTLLPQTGLSKFVIHRNLVSQKQSDNMIDLDWMTSLVSRTIGANRGRAARGSPQF
ncbi:MAG: hypothetical protein QNK92_12860 [Amylibacter sp.]